MNVLFISEFFYPILKGGGERSAFKLVKAIAKRVEKVYVLTTGDDTNEIIGNIEIFRVLKTGYLKDPRRFMIFEKSMLDAVKLYSLVYHFDVIHCLNATSIPIIKLKDEMTNTKFIAHINSYVTVCPKGTLIYKDQDVRRECKVECSYKTCLDCCYNSRLFGISEPDWKSWMKPVIFTALYIRYRNNLKYLKQFDKLIAISKQTKNVLNRKGLENVEVIYYGS